MWRLTLPLAWRPPIPSLFIPYSTPLCFHELLPLSLFLFIILQQSNRVWDASDFHKSQCNSGTSYNISNFHVVESNLYTDIIRICIITFFHAVQSGILDQTSASFATSILWICTSSSCSALPTPANLRKQEPLCRTDRRNLSKVVV